MNKNDDDYDTENLRACYKEELMNARSCKGLTSIEHSCKDKCV